MLTPNKTHDPSKHLRNREEFAKEMEHRATKQRNGLFKQEMPLTVGDGSTCYQTFRKNHDEVGRNKSVTVNPCKSSTE